MRGALQQDIELAGFVITREEWRSMDPAQRAQLLRAVTRRDEPWMPAIPPRPVTAVGTAPVHRAATVDDAYELYEITAVPA